MLTALSFFSFRFGAACEMGGGALQQKGEWYCSDEALRIAENVLLYQRNNGGWIKNVDMAKRIARFFVDAMKLLNSRWLKLNMSEELVIGGTLIILMSY